MDDLDRKIINILGQRGRAPNAHIARDVGVSEGTVRRRLKRLINEKIITVVAQPDPRKLGYESEALIGVQVDPDKIDAVHWRRPPYGDFRQPRRCEEVCRNTGVSRSSLRAPGRQFA